MKTPYSDLHLCPNLRDLKQTASLINRACELGYRQIGITFPSNCTEEELQHAQNTLRETGADIVTRADLKPNTTNDLIRSLRKLRRRFEILAVMCDSKTVSRQAAKDRRVDLLNFPSNDYRKRFFDLAEAELASNSLSSFEIDSKQLLVTESHARIRLLSNLRKEVAVAKAFHVPIVFSSGVSDALLIRKPLELAAMASLFDLDKESATKTISLNPAAIVRRNREKLDPEFVAPGIRVIRRGKDC